VCNTRKFGRVAHAGEGGGENHAAHIDTAHSQRSIVEMGSARHLSQSYEMPGEDLPLARGLGHKWAAS
jgi:hypothetical protein